MDMIGWKTLNFVLKTCLVALIVIYIFTIPIKGAVDYAVENDISLSRVKEELESTGLIDFKNADTFDDSKFDLVTGGKQGIKSTILGIDKIINSSISSSAKRDGKMMWRIIGEATGLGSNLGSVLDSLLGL